VSTTLLARVVTLLTATISVPLTLSYLGKEGFGLWMTITSAFAFLNFADFGLGSGVLNTLTGAIAKQDRCSARQIVSTATSLLTLIATIPFLLLAAWLYASNVAHVRWAVLGREPGIQVAVQILAACFVVSLPIALVKRVQLAFQEAHRVSLWDTAAGVTGFIALILAVRLRSGVAGLTLAVFGSSTVVLLLNYCVQFFWLRPWLRPSFALCQWKTATQLLKTGSFFCCLQLLAFLHTSADNLLIARYQGVGAVAAYAVVQKVALLLLIVPQAAAVPLWAAFADAVARSDGEWVTRVLKQSLVLLGMYGLLSGVMLSATGKIIIRWWLNGRVDPGAYLLVGFGLYVFVSALALPISSLACTSGLLRWNLFYSALAILSALAAKIWALKNGFIPGAIWGMALCLFLLYVLPLGALLLRHGKARNDCPST